MGGDAFRVYGTAAPENNQTSPAGGMRGEAMRCRRAPMGRLPMR